MKYIFEYKLGEDVVRASIRFHKLTPRAELKNCVVHVVNRFIFCVVPKRGIYANNLPVNGVKRINASLIKREAEYRSCLQDSPQAVLQLLERLGLVAAGTYEKLKQYMHELHLRNCHYRNRDDLYGLLYQFDLKLTKTQEKQLDKVQAFPDLPALSDLHEDDEG